MVPPAVGQGELGRNATYLSARVRDLQVLSKPDAARWRRRDAAASRNLYNVPSTSRAVFFGQRTATCCHAAFTEHFRCRSGYSRSQIISGRGLCYGMLERNLNRAI